MTEKIPQLMSERQIADDPRYQMFKMTVEFLFDHHYFQTAATLVAEYLTQIRRLESAESSGALSTSSVKVAAVIWQNEVRGFSVWWSRGSAETLLAELESKGRTTFVKELSEELAKTAERPGWLRPGQSGD